MARLGIVGLSSLVGLVLLSAAAGAEEKGAIAGVVRDADGKPVAGIEVVLEVGRARIQLTEEFDRWESVRTDRATSDKDGGFKFADVPEGASLLVWAKNDVGFASAHAVPGVTLTLAPLGSVSGKVAGKSMLLKGLRVVALGGVGPYAAGQVDEDSGRFDVAGVAPGESRLHVYRGNFEVARIPIQVVGGEETKVKSVRVTETFLPVADPLVDVLRVRLVDSDGRPMRGVQFSWSSQWMDGGMNSDEEGIVRLAGGGVAIGGPPYRLRLSDLRLGTSVFRGAVTGGGKGGVATVQLESLSEVTGTVSVGGKARDLYRLYAVTDGKAPRAHTATVEKGRYSIHLPEGSCRIVILTADARLHEGTVQVASSNSPTSRDITLP
jgi:hypothetical protein